MTITLRSFVLFSLCAAAQTASAQQGVASRDVKPQAAPAPSQRPFPARLADVAEAAGLNTPVIYGGVNARNTFWRPTVAVAPSLIMTTMVGWTSSCFQEPAWRQTARSDKSAL